jgi:hypothetical protein
MLTSVRTYLVIQEDVQVCNEDLSSCICKTCYICGFPVGYTTRIVIKGRSSQRFVGVLLRKHPTLKVEFERWGPRPCVCRASLP